MSKNKSLKKVMPILSFFVFTIGALILFSANAFFYDTNSNVGLFYVNMEPDPSDFQNEGVYLPKNGIGYRTDDETGKIIFFDHGKDWRSYVIQIPWITPIIYQLTNQIPAFEITYETLYTPPWAYPTNFYVIEHGGAYLLQPPATFEQEDASTVTKADLEKYFDYYTNEEVNRIFVQSFRNDVYGEKRPAFTMLGYGLILAGIMFMYYLLRERERLFTLVATGMITLLVALRLVIDYFIPVGDTGIRTAVIVFATLLVGYAAFNFKKIKGDSSEQMFP